RPDREARRARRAPPADQIAPRSPGDRRARGASQRRAPPRAEAARDREAAPRRTPRARAAPEDDGGAAGGVETGGGALARVEGEPDPDGADCVSCGRCCPPGPKTVHLLETDD